MRELIRDGFVNSSKPDIRFDNLLKKFKPTLEMLGDLNIKFMIGGGCIRDYFTSKKVTDIDIFTTNQYSVRKILRFFADSKAEVILNNHKVTKVILNDITYDIIKLNFDNAVSLIENFDFTVTQFVIDDTHSFYYTREAFVDLAKKQLMLANLPYPESTMLRVIKYMNKGFKICNEEMNKIIFKLKATGDITNYDKEKLHPYTIDVYKPTYLPEPVIVNADIHNTIHNQTIEINEGYLESIGFVIDYENTFSNNEDDYEHYGID